MNHVTHPMSPADISNQEISKFCYIKRYMYRLHFDTKFLIILAFLEPLRIVLIKKVANLMMSAKMATPGLLKITVFWNKSYDVITLVHDVTNKFLSRDSNYIVYVVMWPKFGSSNISMREVIMISILQGFDQKNCFFWRWFWFKFNNLGLALGMNLEFYTSVAKGLKLKVRKFYGLVLTFVEVTGEKLVGGPFCHLPPLSILNSVKTSWTFKQVQWMFSGVLGGFFIMPDVEKRKAILVACCPNNLYGRYASLQTFFNFLIMKKQQKRNKIIRKFIPSTISKSIKKKAKRNSPRFWIRPGQTSSWWDNFCTGQ